ncbi:MAG: tRNA lysidine(34) synthetase TilS [Clostridia bacterium]|nr:tRNA lysidine(34) synthetase TilS [Clostridia bacterium]
MLLKLQFPPDIPQNAPLLVAYSGGADSSLLLSLAKAYGETHQVPVFAAHLHHGIRGEEADRDLDFCRRTAQVLGIPLFEKRVDIPALALASGKSLETEAREQRYAFFREVMEAREIPLLLTAHHADDQLETLLFRFLRGSGTKGMGGIPETRPLAYGIAVRPLLSLTRAEILEACRTLGISYVTDSTNEDDFAARNRIRKEITPLLESLSDKGIPQQAAGRLSRAAREDDDCLTRLAEAQVNVLTRPDEGLPLSTLQSQHPAIAKRMMSILYDRVTAHRDLRDGSGTLSAVHLEALQELVQKGLPESSLSLPRNTEARIRDGRLYIRPVSDDPAPLVPVPLYEGDTPWDGGQWIIRITNGQKPPPLSDGETLLATAAFPADKLPLPLWARPRKAGDVIQNHGMHKKLKKLLCDKGVSPYLRDRLPLVCHGDGMTPLWYPTVAFADGFPPPSEGQTLCVSIIKTKISRKEDTYE